MLGRTLTFKVSNPMAGWAPFKFDRGRFYLGRRRSWAARKKRLACGDSWPKILNGVPLGRSTWDHGPLGRSAWRKNTVKVAGSADERTWAARVRHLVAV